METTRKLDVFENTPIPNAVMQLSMPMVVSSLVMVLYSLTDTYFVGMLNNPVQNAAVTLAAPVLLAFIAVNNLFGVGSSSMMSRAMGAKNYDVVYHSSAFGFYCSLFSGILFSLVCIVVQNPLLNLLGVDDITRQATLEYMTWTVFCGATPAILNVVMAYLVRAEGASLHASIGTMTGCILNMILDPFFILPQFLDMGAAGAGLATFLSNCVACIYFFVLLYAKRKSTFVCLNPRMLSFERSLVLNICGVGVPAAIQNLLNVTSMTILNNFTAGYGADAIAAMGIAQKINMVPVQVCLGFSQGVMPLISYNYTSGNRKRMKDCIFFTIKLIFPVLILATALFCVFSSGLVALFMDNKEIITHGTHFLRGFSLSIPFLCLDFLAVGVFQALGRGRSALVFAILRKIILQVPALFILDYLFPLYGLVYSQFVAELVLGICGFVMILHICNEKPGQGRSSKGLLSANRMQKEKRME
ncbi:MAG: MATE family efflux transporter [Clostridiales bacterium]|nr:MATE family efflux transporter [Clostridiales bacterium]